MLCYYVLLLDKFKCKAVLNQEYKNKPLDVQFYFFPSIRVLKLLFDNRSFDRVLEINRLLVPIPKKKHRK